MTCSEAGDEWVLTELCGESSSCTSGVCMCEAGFTPSAEGCVAWQGEACVEGFGPDGERPGCFPLLQPATCTLSEAAAVKTCVAVGVGECLEGFQERSDQEGCQPAATECLQGEVSGLGWTLCEPTQRPCVEGGTWPKVPEGEFSEVLYVDAAASAGGTGSLDSPIHSLADAVQTAQSGALILVAPGTYSEGLHIERELAVVGACPGKVILSGGVSAEASGWLETQRFAVWVDTDLPVFLSGFSISGDLEGLADGMSGVLAAPGSSVTVLDVVMTAMVGGCVAALKPDFLQVEGLHCEQPLALDTSPLGPNGFGVYVDGEDSDSYVSVSASRFFKVQGYDIWLRGTQGEVRDNWFEGRGVWSGQEPMGIRLDNALNVTVAANRFKDKMQHALYAVNGQITFENNYVDGMISDYEDINGPAVKVVDGYALIEGNWFHSNQFGSVLLERSEGEIRGNVMEGTYPSDPGQKGGDGVVLSGCSGETVKVSGNTLVGNTRNGILVSGSNALVLNNVIVDMEASPLSGSEAAGAINVVGKSTATVSGNRVRRNLASGIRMDGSFGGVVGNDVEGVAVHPLGGCSAGIRVRNSFLGEVSGNRVSGVVGAGIYVQGGKINSIEFNAILGSRQSDRGPGVGIWVEESQSTIHGNVVQGADDVGIWGRGLSGSVEHNVIEGCGAKSGFGGLVVGDVVSPPVDVLGNTLLANVGRGMVALQVYGQYRGNVVLETAPYKEGLGVGVWVQGEGEFSLSRNVIEGGHAAGILLKDAPSVTIGSTVVRGVNGGKLPFGAKMMDAAEGVIVLTGSVATVVNCVVVGMAGSGLYIGQGAEATLANCEVRECGGSGVEAVGTFIDEGVRFLDNLGPAVVPDSGRVLHVDALVEPAICGGD